MLSFPALARATVTESLHLTPVQLRRVCDRKHFDLATSGELREIDQIVAVHTLPGAFAMRAVLRVHSRCKVAVIAWAEGHA
jgi:hypothetical protein